MKNQGKPIDPCGHVDVTGDAEDSADDIYTSCDRGKKRRTTRFLTESLREMKESIDKGRRSTKNRTMT